MDYSDLQFHNIQLMKLVSSAEILFQHLYELVSVENKAFISQWLCYKQEYDGDSSNSQFDINENVQECPALTRIDEVSENEKISSISSSVSTTSSDSSVSSEIVEKKNLHDAATKETIKSLGTSTVPSIDNNVPQVDADLLEYMTEFKLFTDSYVSDWFKTISFSTSEIKQYMSWLENKEYKKIWTDIYNNSRRSSELNNRSGSEHDPVVQAILEDPGRTFIPIEASHLPKKPSTDYMNPNRRNSMNYVNNGYVHHEEYIDQHIRYLQEIRHVLMYVREKLNNKFKKDELKSSAEFKSCLKVDVAFEIIDISIEMKNQLKLGRNIEDLAINDEVDTVIADCLRVLSLTEIRHLLLTYLSNVIDMRKCSSENDKQVMKLDSEISNLKILIWRLSYENRCLNLHKEFEQKLQLMGKATTTDESNDESITNVQSRKLLSIVAKKDVQESSQSDSKDVQTAISCIPNIPERSLKTLQSTMGSSAGTKVTRNKKKLIIRTQKH